MLRGVNVSTGSPPSSGTRNHGHAAANAPMKRHVKTTIASFRRQAEAALALSISEFVRGDFAFKSNALAILRLRSICIDAEVAKIGTMRGARPSVRIPDRAISSKKIARASANASGGVGHPAARTIAIKRLKAASSSAPWLLCSAAAIAREPRVGFLDLVLVFRVFGEDMSRQLLR